MYCSSGLVRQGDALLCINEVPIEFESYGNVLATLRGEFPITLTFGRTSEELAREVREDVIRRALQVRESEDRKRLEDLEAARIQRENEQRRQLSGQRKSQVVIPPTYIQNVYTYTWTYNDDYDAYMYIR